MKLKVKLFSQNDMWKGVKLGTSTVSTIGGEGCLLSDVAMVLNYYGKDTDPEKLNTDLKRVKGFYKANRLIYGAVTDIYPDITVDWDNFIDCSTVPAPLDKIDEILFSKRPVIVKVDYDKNTSKIDEHWVTIVGKTEDGAYLINDPIDGSDQFFHARYGDPKRYIFKIVTYNGEIPDDTADEDRIKDLETKVKTLNEQVATLSLENNQLRTDLSTQEADNKDITEQLRQARSEKDKISWDKEQLEIKNKELLDKTETLQSDIDTHKKKETTLRTQLKQLKEQSVEGLSAFELIVLAVKKLRR